LSGPIDEHNLVHASLGKNFEFDAGGFVGLD
jgi:hypothetical protein